MYKVQLPRDVDERLNSLALRTGKSKSYYIREAILNHLDDIEERFLALSAAQTGDDRNDNELTKMTF